MVIAIRMAKPEKSRSRSESGDQIKNICRNRRATHDFEIHDRIECGLVLQGTEVKSLREGNASLEDAYAKIENGEAWLLGCEIQEYSYGNRLNHKPKRPRKLLLHRREIQKIAGKAAQKGFTLVPLQLYFKNGVAKVEVGVARGKQAHDKRQSLKQAEAKREIDRAMMSAARRRQR